MPQIRTPDGDILTVEGEVVDGEVYGAPFKLPSLAQLRWIAEWGPFFSNLQAMATAATAYDKAVLLCKALDFAAGKTDTALDDQLVKRAESLLKSEDGRKLFDLIVEVVT